MKMNYEKIKETLLNPKVIKFCNLLAPNTEIEIIPVKPELFLNVKNLYNEDRYNNVQKQVDIKGGTMIYGWIVNIYIKDGKIVYLESQANALWQNTQGEKICISPQYNEYIVFIEDKENRIINDKLMLNYRAPMINKEFNSNMLKLLELKDYTNTMLVKYLDSHFGKIYYNDYLGFQYEDSLLIFSYKNKSYPIVDKELISIYNVSEKIKEVELNPFLFNIERSMEGVAKMINYKFKYLLDISL